MNRREMESSVLYKALENDKWKYQLKSILNSQAEGYVGTYNIKKDLL